MELTAPPLAVVVATHGRPLRLRWLLSALEEQTTGSFEVVVAHNPGDPSETVLADYPYVREVVAPGGVSALRNAAVQTVRAPLVAFTDDDCRPPADWVANALAAAEAHPGAIVQGTTLPDPDELEVYRRAPHARSQEIHPPVAVAQTCNILYPRAVLEATGGFDPAFRAGEDADHALRARAAGTPYAGAPEMLTYHAVETGLVRKLRQTWRWQQMALLVQRHPELRQEFPLRGYAWKTRHAWLALALAGGAGAAAARSPRAAALAAVTAAPYLATTPRRYGASPRGLARTATELPGRALVDTAELAALLYGSVRHRTFLL